jgi:tRNA (guanine37-N1)-methyltransferase
VRYFADEELSVGDFVITGGEAAALCVLESIVRLLPGVLGNEESVSEESFSPACRGLLEYPQYTRPPSFSGYDVPRCSGAATTGASANFDRGPRSAGRVVRRPDLTPPNGAGDETARRRARALSRFSTASGRS